MMDDFTSALIKDVAVLSINSYKLSCLNRVELNERKLLILNFESLAPLITLLYFTISVIIMTCYQWPIMRIMTFFTMLYCKKDL